MNEKNVRQEKYAEAEVYLESHPKMPRARTEEEWSKIFVRYPLDESGYAKALPPSDALEKYGLAVVQLFDPATCDATVTAMFDEINSTRDVGDRPKVRVDTPDTWHDKNWPRRSKFLLRDPALCQQAFTNRISNAVYELFCEIWGEHRLRVSIDNWGLSRGTKQLPLTDASGSVTPTDKPRWSAHINPHWDYNPWLLTQELKSGRTPGYQAAVALNDQPSKSGCHMTLPGCLPFLPDWCRERSLPEALGQKRRSHRPQPEDPILNYMQEIPLRKGQMVIWSWGQLHAAATNETAGIRLVQFIRMFPAREVDPFYETHDRYAPSRVLQSYPSALENIALDPRGRKLLGVDSW